MGWLDTYKQAFEDGLADAIFIEELYRHDLYDKVSQAFAVFLPIKSVGVMGRVSHLLLLNGNKPRRR